MIKVNPYLTFDGECEEAFKLYSSVFASELKFFSRYSDIPSDKSVVAAGDELKVLYVSMKLVDGVQLMGSDVTPLFGKEVSKGNNTSISLSMEDKTEAQRIFAELSEGGQVLMPLRTTFWAELYGMLIDPFGVSWIISYVGTEV